MHVSVGVFGPGVFAVSSPEIFPDLEVGFAPEVFKIVGDLLRAIVGGE